MSDRAAEIQRVRTARRLALTGEPALVVVRGPLGAEVVEASGERLFELLVHHGARVAPETDRSQGAESAAGDQ